MLKIEYSYPEAKSGELEIPVRLDPTSKEPGFGRIEVTLQPITVVAGRVHAEGVPLAEATLAAFPMHDGAPELTSVALRKPAKTEYLLGS